MQPETLSPVAALEHDTVARLLDYGMLRALRGSLILPPTMGVPIDAVIRFSGEVPEEGLTQIDEGEVDSHRDDYRKDYLIRLTNRLEFKLPRAPVNEFLKSRLVERKLVTATST